eukprot:5129037-Lingulodinium_polyedra.AAC.1
MPTLWQSLLRRPHLPPIRAYCALRDEGVRDGQGPGGLPTPKNPVEPIVAQPLENILLVRTRDRRNTSQRRGGG